MSWNSPSAAVSGSFPDFKKHPMTELLQLFEFLSARFEIPLKYRDITKKMRPSTLFLVAVSPGICIPLSLLQFCGLSWLFAAAGLQLRLPASPAVHLGSDPQSSGVAAHLLHSGARRKRAGRRTRLSRLFVTSSLSARTETKLICVYEKARRRAMDDPDYLRGVLLEVQRLWPPFIGGRRIADQVGLFCILLIFMKYWLSLLQSR